MRFTAVFAALTVVPFIAGQAAAQDAAAGEKVFAKCKACHVADEDKNKIGPSLMGVIGKTAGTHEGYKYSKAMIEAGEGGLVWDDENLSAYLRDPKGLVKGTKMAFAGLKKDEEIANVIAYLKQFSQ
ncbi:MAG: cytochrome c family protein [Pseudomonadota bacterium]|nr:cytochrome c family protein [Pseudomonadota bacterium]